MNDFENNLTCKWQKNNFENNLTCKQNFGQKYGRSSICC